MTIAQILAEARSLADADATSYPLVTSGQEDVLLRRINLIYEEIVGKLIVLDKNWNFGDTNYAALPTGTQTLVNGTQAYAFSADLLNVVQVQVKDASGIWHLLNPITNIQDLGMPIEEYQKVDGMPTEYYKQENFLLLFPAPATGSVTMANGLKVIFQRTASTFTTTEATTGTKSPGFASPFHVILAYKAALPYVAAFVKDRVPYIMAEINRIETEMFNFYSAKDKDVKKVMTNSGITFR